MNLFRYDRSRTNLRSVESLLGTLNRRPCKRTLLHLSIAPLASIVVTKDARRGDSTWWNLLRGGGVWDHSHPTPFETILCAHLDEHQLSRKWNRRPPTGNALLGAGLVATSP